MKFKIAIYNKRRPAAGGNSLTWHIRFIIAIIVVDVVCVKRYLIVIAVVDTVYSRKVPSAFPLPISQNSLAFEVVAWSQILLLDISLLVAIQIVDEVGARVRVHRSHGTRIIFALVLVIGRYSLQSLEVWVV